MPAFLLSFSFFRIGLSRFCLSIFFCWLSGSVMEAAFAQIPVIRYDSIIVTESQDTLKNAWAGGINSAQISEIDLNLDGLKDLVLFEKDGFIARTFINNGSDYSFTTAYRPDFPAMTVFSFFSDYNCDNKEDLFVFAPGLGGMAVYKNTSSQLGGLSFSLVAPILNADYNPGFYNLYVAATDLPALTDIDGDGDMDILSFDNGGTVVNYYKNLSLETYGICDSLSFQLVDACWGKFFENSNNNSVIFPFNCKGPVYNPVPDNIKHTGSTLLAINLDGDTDKDLVLGDVSFKNMVKLTNGGDAFSATITAQDISFPSNSTPVNLLFPAGFYLDADHDSVKDLLVTPNTTNASENFTSVWLYKNSGTNESPVFTFQKNNFLQDEMIDLGSGCNPVFFDYNADGRMDIVAGNYGYYNDATGMYDGRLALFENTGTSASPKFELVNRDFANASSLKINALYPAFGDIDGDGDEDMIAGEYNGKLLHYENMAGAGNTVSFVLKNLKYGNIDVGHFAAPQLIDLNRDGLLDLLIGEQDGTLNYFQNSGSATTAVFDSMPTKSKLGNIDVEPLCCTGYSTPFLFENAPGNYALLVGSEKGTVYLFTGIDGNLSGSFVLADSLFLDEHRSSVCMRDIDQNGKYEMIAGTYAGGMQILKTGFLLSLNGEEFIYNGIEIYPNPARGNFLVRINDPDFTGATIEVTNMLGSKILVSKAQWPLTEIALEAPPGIYMVHIVSRMKSWLRKIVILK